MIVLDTNVLSELMRAAPSPAVEGWVRGRSATELGSAIDGFDAQIASICRARDAALATRDVSDFADTGITLIDPWQSVP